MEKDTSNIWEELSKKYDVTNATFDELKEISMSLYEYGEISFKGHAILTFDFDRGAESLKEEISGLSPILLCMPHKLMHLEKEIG
ncbi:hypothetical protein GCM10011409_39970 [Lentibacillus populi]|uniref:Uncharacterized protein n=2 Tax=Lentibacillus populi TaxID=1827502 RepID=A0A9W5U1I9_9BACI|nr:hypothetical protein GCM10011409_39970 [Lentibacillus populi]